MPGTKALEGECEAIEYISMGNQCNSIAYISTPLQYIKLSIVKILVGISPSKSIITHSPSNIINKSSVSSYNCETLLHHVSLALAHLKLQDLWNS